MRILIIEDEPQAAKRIETLVHELVPNAHVVGKLDSVRESVHWFKNNPMPEYFGIA